MRDSGSPTAEPEPVEAVLVCMLWCFCVASLLALYLVAKSDSCSTVCRFTTSREFEAPEMERLILREQQFPNRVQPRIRRVK